MYKLRNLCWTIVLLIQIVGFGFIKGHFLFLESLKVKTKATKSQKNQEKVLSNLRFSFHFSILISLTCDRLIEVTYVKVTSLSDSAIHSG